MPYTPTNNPYAPGDPYMYDLKWVVDRLKKIDSELASAIQTYGSPLVVNTAAEMTDPERVYIYLGNEAGYINGDWYYFDKNTNLWTSGGAYGGYPVDSALNPNSSNAVENKIITKALDNISETAKDCESIIPIYRGDIYNSAAGAVCKNNNMIYMLSAYNNSSNEGKLYIINDSNNIIESELTSVYCGHGNSMTYNEKENAFYIAPVFYYDASNVRYETLQIIKYDSSFSSFETITAPEIAMGISYDNSTEKMYIYCYSGNIYEYINNTWQLRGSIGQHPNLNQDFAIYNNKFVINGPQGLMLEGIIKEDSTKLIKYGVCSSFDTTHKWILGEYEGIDFDNKGRLYGVNYINVSQTGYPQAYCLELPISFCENQIRPESYTYEPLRDTTPITDDSINKFMLDYNEFRHLNQIINSNIKPNTVFYGATSNKYAEVNVVITSPLTISFAANCFFYATRVYVRAPLALYGASNSQIKITSTASLFALDRLGSLTIAGTALRVTGIGLFANMLINYRNMLNVNTIPVYVDGVTRAQWQSGGNNMQRALYTGLTVVATY